MKCPCHYWTCVGAQSCERYNPSVVYIDLIGKSLKRESRDAGSIPDVYFSHYWFAPFRLALMTAINQSANLQIAPGISHIKSVCPQRYQQRPQRIWGELVKFKSSFERSLIHLLNSCF